jgi:hypothetical protein
MGNKKAKQEREDASAMEWLQSSIEKCITGVVTNSMAREEKEAAREEKEAAREENKAAREVKFDAH